MYTFLKLVLRKRRQSMDEGLKNLVTKAEQGDVAAMVMVGDCYNKGLHTEKK